MNPKKLTPRKLMEAARDGKIPIHTPITALAKTQMRNGWSALHNAAACNHLPANTTLQELLKPTDNHGYTPLDAVICEGHCVQLPMLLENTKASSAKEIKQIAVTLNGRIQPVKLAFWITRELMQLNSDSVEVTQ